MPLERGSRLGPYRIVGAIGAGGMGEVYRAHHLKLGRDVALKVLPAEMARDPERLARFEREARTASALNHPHIVTIYDIVEHEGTTCLAMELVEGPTLRELLEREGPLPVERVLDYASQIADGLAVAHGAGIVHRDVKPANVMITAEGRVKILDFGLAKPVLTPDGRELAASALTLTSETRADTLLGTPHYMSPEQLEGAPADHRSDQFAFGVVLYELLGGAPPFQGPSLPAVIGAILSRPPPPLRSTRAEVPADLERIVVRCLEKDPDDRFVTMAELRGELSRCVEKRARARRGFRGILRRPAGAATMAILVAVTGAVGWLWTSGADRRWAEREALGQITALVETGDLFGAYRTALVAEPYLPDDPELDRVIERITLPMTVSSQPAGAEVLVRAYADPASEWQPLGVTPLSLRIPYAAMEWRIAKEGYETFEGAPFSPGSLRALASGIVLDTLGAPPAGTVRIPAGRLEGTALIQPVRMLAGAEGGTFYFDRFEVTNREFQAFVDAGGYEDRRWWPDPIEREGEVIAWEEAVDQLRDLTGRHGPSTWELGDYPEGEDDYPVGGISWFEAAAYCASVGGSLPTVYDWFRALGQEQVSDILLHSNMDGEAKAPVGRFGGLAAYGTYDMAGNVKEWAWNATGEDRYVLGGSWNEPTYIFRHVVAQDPWNRDPTNGVRCAHYPEPPAEHLRAPISPSREYPRPDPIGDEAFAALRGLYAYDEDPLDARVERVNDSLAAYRRETVSLRTAYGNERMEVHLLIPRDVEPPYQSVIWFPGDDVFGRASSDDFSSAWLFDFLPRAGRVLVHPVYRGMYERAEPWERTPNDWRDMVISWAQDIGRTIDYLETRPDFDATRIAYYGFSSGGLYAPTFMAVEPRIAVGMIIGGGLVPLPLHPAMDPTHFAPRTSTPTLMINGRDDFLTPYELASRPFFELLGAPDEDKRHARLAGGHIPTEPREIIREVLDWLDRYLGPVREAGAALP